MTKDKTTDLAELEDRLTSLSLQHRKTYEDMVCIENEMEDIRKQLKAAGHRAFIDEC